MVGRLQVSDLKISSLLFADDEILIGLTSTTLSGSVHWLSVKWQG